MFCKHAKCAILPLLLSLVGGRVSTLHAASLTMEWLYNYIQQGQLQQIAPYFQNNPSLELRDRNGNTALCQAILNQDQMMVRKLLYLGANRYAECMKRISSQKLSQMGLSSRPIQTSPVYLSKSPKSTSIVPNIFKSKSFLLFALVGGAAGVAAFAGGGGGGGSHSTPKNPEHTDLDPTTSIPAIPYSYQCPNGTVLINGVCTKVYTEGADGKTPISTISGDNPPYYLAEFGGKVSNSGQYEYEGETSEQVVAMRSNGVSASALSSDGKTVYLSGASSATNTQTGSLTMDEKSTSDQGVIAMYGSAAGNITNKGNITINSLSHAESAAMKIDRDDAKSIYGTGPDVVNSGTITMTDAGDGMGVLSAISTPGRNVTNTGNIDLFLKTNESAPINNDTRGTIQGLYGKNIVNKGKISLSTSDSGTAINTEAYLIRGYGDENSITANDGVLNIELTNIAWNIYGVWSDASAELGAVVKNTGDINVTGALYNARALDNTTMAKQVYLVGTNGGISTIKNVGNINVGSISNPIDVSMGGVINALNGGNSSVMENQKPINFHLKASPTQNSNDFTALAMYLTDGTLTNDGDINYSFTNKNDNNDISNQLIQLETIRTVNAKVENKANITSTLTGTAAPNSYFSSVRTSTGEISNSGNLTATSDINNLALYGLTTSKGTATNLEGARISLTTSGENAELAGGKFFGNGFGLNAGFVYLIHNGGSGDISGFSGGNSGFIQIEAHDMTGYSHISGGQTIGSYENHTSSTPNENGATTATTDAEGMINISLTGRTAGSVYGYEYANGEGASACTSANTINITANSNTRNGNLSINGIYANGPVSLNRNGTITIEAFGSQNYSTDIVGIMSKNTYTTNNEKSVVNLKVNLNDSTKHSIIGMKHIDTSTPPTGQITSHISYDGSDKQGKTQPTGYIAWNKGTLSLEISGQGYNPNPDPDIPFDVVGIATNAYALNTGTIAIKVGSLDARTAGMVAYDGGVIVNKGTISFSGNADNFVPMYATGYQGFFKAIYTQTTSTVYRGIFYATIYNAGDIIVDNFSDFNPQGVGYSSTTISEDDLSNPIKLWAKYTREVYQDIENERITEVDTRTGKKEFGDPVDPFPVPPFPLAQSNNSGNNNSSNNSTNTNSTQITPQTTTSRASMQINNGVRYVSESGGSFIANNVHLLGDVTAGTTLVQGSNSDTYVSEGSGMGALVGDGDFSDLTLDSNSALFTPSYAHNKTNPNGIDIVMKRKSFHELIANASLASFLEKNYKSGNNIAFFDQLKSFSNMNKLTHALNNLTGKEILSRFNFEDLSMMKELNFDMNEKLFHNKSDSFATAGMLKPLAFKGDTGSSTRYSLFNKRNGDYSVGLGVAFSNINSGNQTKGNKRQSVLYQLSMPIGMRKYGFNFITSPRLGYARGTYKRNGFNDTTYKGVVEKKVFGLMNEVRYPFKLGSWTLEPTSEFNVLGSIQRGGESKKDYSLNIKSQTNYSVESGVGLWLSKEMELPKDSRLKFTLGAMAYHDFTDPYKLKVGMTGMDGFFTLHDEDHSQNHQLLKAAFEYDNKNYSLYGAFTSFIDKEIHSVITSGLKGEF